MDGPEPVRSGRKEGRVASAVSAVAKTLALVKDNICVNPGLIQTPDWVKTAKDLTSRQGRRLQGYVQSVADEHAAVKRFASAEELAHFFVFLCSDKATYSVGSTTFVDGGMLKTV